MMNITEERRKQAGMLISFFNMKNGCRFKYADKNVEAAANAIDAANGDLAEVRKFMRIPENICKDVNGACSFINTCQAFVDSKSVKDAQVVEVQPVPAVQNPAPAVDNLTASMNFMGQVVMELLAKTKLEEVEATVGSRLEDHVKKFIADNYGTIQRKVEFQLPERKVELQGVVHEKFETVLKFVQADEPVFLTGPAGSGKNYLCKQVADTLGLPFYFSNAVTQEYKITGFTDAMGVFHESQFYKAFKNGGVFMLDEMDASIPEVLIILNAAIANRYFDFPAPIGYVEAHKDFRVIAAGNTFGNGADYDYVGRNQLDAASLDRFAQVRIDYDQRIEYSCANGDEDLLKFCRAFRKATQKAGIRTVVSCRAISRMAKLSQCMDAADLLDSCLIKSLETDDLNAIRNDLSGCGKYSAGFEKVLSNRKAA